MRRLLFVCLLFWVAGTLVYAQSAGGSSGSGIPGKTFTNDSPTPLWGFTQFSTSCVVIIGFQNMNVCSSDVCTATSPNIVCKSPFLTGGNKTCIAPTSLTDWGVNSTLTGSCCTAAGVCSSLNPASPWSVGVSPSAGITTSTVPPVFDARSVSVVRRSLNEWVAVFTTNSRPKITRTTNGGLSWSTPIFVSDTISPSTLPSNVPLSDVEVVYPSLALGVDGSVHLAFTARDSVSGMSTVYYTACSASNACTSKSEWRNATPLFGPAFDQLNGEWKYAFGQPKIVVDATTVHIVFDDTQPESPARLDAILYRSCLLSTSCDAFSEFTSPVSPDILNGLNGGYPHSPSLAMDATGGLHVAYLDNGGIFYTRFFPDPSQFSLGWFTSQPVLSGNGFSPPSIASGSDRVMMTTSEGGVVRVLLCDADDCTSSATSSPSWDDLSDSFSSLNGVSSPTSVVGMVAPASGNDIAVFLTGIVNGTRQVMGQYLNVSTSQTSGLRTLSTGTTDAALTGISDTWGSFVASNGGLSMVDLFVSPPANSYVLSSNVLDATDSNPVLSNLSPDSGTWTNTSTLPSSTVFTKNVSFSVKDDDASDTLYASVFLSTSPGGEDFPLLQYASLSKPLTTLGVSCSSSTFTSPVSCTIGVNLFKPNQGLIVPNGDYYLVVKAYDSVGGKDVVSSSQPIAVTASLAQLLVNKPVNGDKWSTQNVSTQKLDFVAQTATFAQKLGLKALLFDSTGNPIDLGLIDLVTNSDVDSLCSKSSTDYLCNIPIGVPADLPEGKYDLHLYVSEDGFDGANKSVANMTLDYQSPHVVSNQPSGTVSSFPKTISFSLSDFSGIDTSKSIQVSINGAPSASSPTCSPNAGIVSAVNCTVPLDASSLSFQSSSSSIDVDVTSTDGLGNTGQTSFGFTVGQAPPGGTGGSGGGGGGGGGGNPVIPSLDDVVTQLPNGDIVINGTGIVIPNQVVDSFNNFSNRVVRSTSELVEVVGPSAAAIFFGLCTLAGIASDIVFRRVFAKVVAENERQRQRVLRMVLGLLFFMLPVLVGWQFSLAIGFIFVVLEVVFFIGAAYLFKILQYYETFGFKPIEAAK